MMSPNILLKDDSVEAVSDMLDDFIRVCHLNYAMICDIQGFVLLFRSAIWAPEAPPIDSLAALIVSNYAANDAIAKLLGDEDFKESMQKGTTSGTFIEKINPRLLLVAIFSESTTLGRTKMKSSQLKGPLAKLVKASDRKDIDITNEWGEVNTLMVDKLFEGKL